MMGEKPNVLLLVVDCLRADRTYETAGGAKVPAMRALRDRGFTFETAVSSATNTTPSFASLLSSLYGFRHGVRSLRGYRVKEEVPVLPEIFRNAGYRTIAEVSGPLRKENGLDRGFDEYHYREKGMSLYSTFLGKIRRRVRSASAQPFFLMLHLWSLHRPRKIRRGWNRPEYGETIYDRSLSSLDDRLSLFLPDLPPNTIVILTGDHGERMNEGDEDPENHRIAAPLPVLENLYENLHHYGKRRRQRHAKREGDEIGPLGGACHGFHVYEDLVRVPLVFAGPGIPAGRSNASLVRHVDIGPTLLDLLGIEVPEGFGRDGRSLVPLLTGENLPAMPAYVEATGQNLQSPTRWIASVRTEAMKYCRGLLDPDMPEELYDLVTDPEERNNLAPDDPRMPGMRELFTAIAGDSLTAGIDTTLSPEEIEKLDDTLRSLGYIE